MSARNVQWRLVGAGVEIQLKQSSKRRSQDQCSKKHSKSKIEGFYALRCPLQNAFLVLLLNLQVFLFLVAALLIRSQNKFITRNFNQQFAFVQLFINFKTTPKPFISRVLAPTIDVRAVFDWSSFARNKRARPTKTIRKRIKSNRDYVQASSSSSSSSNTGAATRWLSSSKCWLSTVNGRT